LGFFGVEGTHGWVRMLKDVDRNGIDEIQGVILVKRQRESCLRGELGCLRMTLDICWVILLWGNFLRVVINIKASCSEATARKTPRLSSL
jgi:hypothetical protein